jgi:flagellar basal-body rod protein FlgB
MDSAPIFDRTVQKIQDRLNVISTSHRLVSGNLANVSTPGYVAKDLSFQQALRESVDEQRLTLATSSPRHVAPDTSAGAPGSAEIREEGPVSVEHEMMKLVRNNVDYQFMVAMLNKKFALLKHAVSEGVS